MMCRKQSINQSMLDRAGVRQCSVGYGGKCLMVAPQYGERAIRYCGGAAVVIVWSGTAAVGPNVDIVNGTR